MVSEVYWFVGATYNGVDQMARFLREGIWENGRTDPRGQALVKEMKVGDTILIKSVYTRKKDLSFDNRGYVVSVMVMKAIGTITGNSGDGHTVWVDWYETMDGARETSLGKEWYFYTYQRSIWKVMRDNWKKEALIDFCMHQKPQDIDRFRNAPYWRAKFGDIVKEMPTSSVETSEYSIEQILEEGAFVDEALLERVLSQLQNKKNLILQGPPGTGKTWLAKRLAYVLIGEKVENESDPAIKQALRVVQFHPSLSYEDFIRGWRPSGNGHLSLMDGPLLQLITSAKEAPEINHVMVIEEINRGNPAQIFGEMLTLLESSKRVEEEALELSYAQTGERIYLPENLYVIGTMNIADRSLALVDFALRRRFAFVDLVPMLGERWKNYLIEQYQVDSALLDQVALNMQSLNQMITEDPHLGSAFCIGHSYVTPHTLFKEQGYRDWYHSVVEMEIIPLLREYWFNDPNKIGQAKSLLLQNI